MRHVFVVHSPITRFVARAVVERERLAPEDVVALTARGAHAGGWAERRIAVSYADVPESPHGLGDALACRRAVARVDRLVAKATGRREFRLYTPQTMERFLQILLNHPRCTSFSLLEEGLHSYCTKEEIERTHPPMRLRRWDRIGYRGRVRAATFLDPGHTAAYGVTPASFPDLPRRVVMTDAIPTASDSVHRGIEHLVVLDGLTTQRRLRLDSLLPVLRRLGGRLGDVGVTQLHYKLHPAQIGTPEADAVMAALAADPRVQAIRLNDEVSLESIARARPTIRWYVNLSSVGFYAAYFGAIVHSFAPWVVEQEPAFEEIVASAPRAFTERVRFLATESEIRPSVSGVGGGEA